MKRVVLVTLAAAAGAASVTAGADRAGRELPTVAGKLFSGSGACAPCHTGMSDEAGRDVSIDSFWRSTMMANAARDPYWRATVAAEIDAHPAYRAVIEDKCATCHTPLARSSAAAEGGKGVLLGEGFLDADHPMHALAMDGVSCTLCHQIEAEGFGERRSFSGGFAIDTGRPAGERVTYGPFPVDEAQATAMQAASGFLPVRSEHVRRSELCATCHTLHTPFIDARGEVGGEFPEQMAYFEYLHSDHARTRSCQSCHMPAATGHVPLAITGGEPRSPFAQHVFVGGNAYGLQWLKASAVELGATASSEHFDATIARVSDQLRRRTATVAIEKARVSGSRLTASVAIRSQVGHKLPTGFPSRRVWIHFTVRDASGEAVFESGGVAPDGSIAGNDNDADAARWEPHHLTVERADQVQIYETILGDVEGKVTTTLLRGSRYLKDNRLLPTGFAKDTAREDIAVRGAARGDPTFLGGGDTTDYRVEVDDAEGPFAVTAELLYQAIGHRWAENLRRHRVPEVTGFLGRRAALPEVPIVVASATAEARK